MSTSFKHAYDPQKAHEYYMRTRKLKGRSSAADEEKVGRVSGSTKTASSSGAAGGKGKSPPSKGQQLKAQREAIEKRLEHLREVLARLVDMAKRRSGVEVKDDDSPSEKAQKNEQQKAAEPLSKAEGDKKNKAAREAYAKENKVSQSDEVKELQAKIADIRKQIQEAYKELLEKQSRNAGKATGNGR